MNICSKKNFLLTLNIIIILINLGCQYHINILEKKSYNNTYVVISSYDAFGLIAQTIRLELYLNGINVLNDSSEIFLKKKKNIYIYYLNIYNVLENRIVTSILHDGSEVGYQLTLNIQGRLLTPNNKNYPIEVYLYYDCVKNSNSSFLSEDTKERTIRKEMYQKAARKIVYKYLLKNEDLSK